MAYKLTLSCYILNLLLSAFMQLQGTYMKIRVTYNMIPNIQLELQNIRDNSNKRFHLAYAKENKISKEAIDKGAIAKSHRVICQILRKNVP